MSNDNHLLRAAAQLDDEADLLEASVRDRRNLAKALRGFVVDPPAAKPKGQQKPKAKRRAPIAEGSLHDRIVSTLREAGEPTKFSVILADANARPADVNRALRELVEDARIVRTGKTASTRYSLP
jgi:hypothetical protein